MAFFGLIGKKSGGYLFHIYDRRGDHIETVNAKLMIDLDNRERKHFVFDKFKDKLDVRAPTKWVDGKPHREATFGISGELVYLEGTLISNDSYLKKSMLPEERQITASKIKENTIRYAQPMNKMMAYGFLSLIVLVLVIIGGTVYSVITEAKISGNFLEASKEASKMGNGLSQASKTNQEVTEQLSRIVASLKSGTDGTMILE